MSPIEWYYAKDDQQIGPVSPAQLKQLAASGGLGPEDLVWREGMDEWTAARNVGGLFQGAPAKAAPPAGPAPPAASLPTIEPVVPGVPGVPGQTALDRAGGRQGKHLFDMMLDAVRAQFTAQFIESTTKIFTACGCYGLYGAMALDLIWSLVVGVKTKDFTMVFWGVISVLVLAVLQYAARRISGALDRLGQTTASSLSTAAFPDCCALLCIVLGVAGLLGFVVLAIQAKDLMLILAGLGLFVVCEYVAILCLNLEALKISVVPEGRAGEEAIGLLSFLAKLLLRLVPVAFGVGVILGTLGLAYGLFLALSVEFDSLPTGLDMDMAAIMGMMAAGSNEVMSMLSVTDTSSTMVRSAAALPLAAYVAFLIYYLSVDIARAVLAVPRKLDRLAGEEAAEDRQER